MRWPRAAAWVIPFPVTTTARRNVMAVGRLALLRCTYARRVGERFCFLPFGAPEAMLLYMGQMEGGLVAGVGGTERRFCGKYMMAMATYMYF